MTTPAESSPPSTDPAWMSSWQPEDPARAAAVRSAQEAAGRERMQVVRQDTVVSGGLVVLGALLLGLDGSAWHVPVAVGCLVSGLVGGTVVTVLRLRQVEQRLAERLRP